MLFCTLDYVAFLTLVVPIFWMLGPTGQGRLVLLFVASCVFYMAWRVKYLALLLGVATVNFFFGLALGKCRSPGARKVLLGSAVSIDLGLLGLFKYFNFFSASVQHGLDLVGIPVDLPMLDVLLPIGISFFTFEAVAYLIDVYRGTIKPTRNFVHYGLFLAFFPHLVAGPILRPADLLPQLEKPSRLDSKMVGDGIYLILRGLVKKLAVADFLAVNLVDRVFDNPGAFTSVEVLVALYAYTIQIYCDFSGYTDAARGSAKLLGLELPENFNRPYLATSPAQFWRRWHMTLSSWLRDYVYYPLGGSRKGWGRTYVNLWITFFLIGFWHGAGWTFVVYGVVQGTAMVIHRFFYKRSGRTAHTVDPTWLTVVKIAATLHFVVFSRILFRSPSLDRAGAIVLQLFKGTTSTAQLPLSIALVIGVAYAVHWSPKKWLGSVQEAFVKLPSPAQGVIAAATCAILVHFATGQVVPYIYFQF